MKHFRFGALSLALAAVSLAAPLAGAAPVVRPAPLKEFCIDNKCVPAPTASANAIKWHPGHYMWLDSAGYSDSAKATHFSNIDDIAGEPTIKGVQLVLYWGDLEGSTPGDYSKGFAIIDAYLAKLASLPTPKRLMLGVLERRFGAVQQVDVDRGRYLPTYLLSADYNGGYVAMPAGSAGGLTLVARVWEPAVTDRLIALSRAYAARYDSNPLFEMLWVGETSLAVPGQAFSPAAYVTQLKRFYAASRGAWSHTALRLTANWIGSDSDMADLIAYSAKLGVTIGGPDVFPRDPGEIEPIQANRVFNGTTGGIDYRGVTPWVSEVQDPELSGRKGMFTPDQLYTYATASMKPQYFIWLRNTWAGGAPQRWSTGILPYIQSVNGATNTDCPRAYTAGCNSN